MNGQSRITSATVQGPPLSWAEQAAQNPWGSSRSTRNSRWIVKSGGAPVSSFSWNCQRTVTSATVQGPPLSWAEQAAQNPWGSSRSTRNSRWIVKSGGAPVSSFSWNCQSRVTSATVQGPPLSWAEQAAQNPWGSSRSTCNSQWIVKTDSVSSTNKEGNPFQGPIIPYKTFGQPKLTLGNWYLKRYQFVLPNNSFECRDNGDAPHLLKWTCTFTCPLTANTFASGQYVGVDSTRFSTSMGRDDCLIVWFYTKKEAEHAAAARALDCLNFMEKELLKGQSRVEYYNYCLELPEIPSIPYPIHTKQASGSCNDEEKYAYEYDMRNA
jgi:hypothetical protein